MVMTSENWSMISVGMMTMMAVLVAKTETRRKPQVWLALKHN